MVAHGVAHGVAGMRRRIVKVGAGAALILVAATIGAPAHAQWRVVEQNGTPKGTVYHIVQTGRGSPTSGNETGGAVGGVTVDDKDVAGKLDDAFDQAAQDTSGYPDDVKNGGPGSKDEEGPWETEDVPGVGTTEIFNTETGERFAVGPPPNPEYGRRLKNILNDYDRRKKRREGRKKDDDDEEFLPADDPTTGVPPVGVGGKTAP